MARNWRDLLIMELATMCQDLWLELEAITSEVATVSDNEAALWGDTTQLLNQAQALLERTNKTIAQQGLRKT